MSQAFRLGAALFVILGVTSAPALTCLSFVAQMDMQQMACCKHMSDDCDMGTGNQSCCGHDSAQSLRAILPDKVIHLQPATVALSLAAESIQPSQTAQARFIFSDDGSPPLQPPGSITVLRI